MRLLVALVLALTWRGALGQQSFGGKVLNFKASGYYEPPHETQMKFLLQGAEGEPQPGGKFSVRQAKLETFQQDGQPEMKVETPQCFYSETNHSVSSPGNLRVESADGKFLIEGEGFLW